MHSLTVSKKTRWSRFPNWLRLNHLKVSQAIVCCYPLQQFPLCTLSICIVFKDFFIVTFFKLHNVEAARKFPIYEVNNQLLNVPCPWEASFIPAPNVFIKVFITNEFASFASAFSLHNNLAWTWQMQNAFARSKLMRSYDGMNASWEFWSLAGV